MLIAQGYVKTKGCSHWLVMLVQPWDEDVPSLFDKLSEGKL